MVLAGPVVAQEKVRVGFIAALTGPQAGPVGIPARNGAELVMEAANRGGLPAPYAAKGFGGREAELLPTDESGTPAAVANEVRALIERSRVHALLGSLNSGTCLAFVPVAEELKTLTILSSCGTPRIFEEASPKYIFRTSANATADGVTAARYLLRTIPDLKSFGGLNANYAFGTDSWRDFRLAMAALRPALEPSIALSPNFLSLQYSTEISALLGAKPQAVFTSFFATEVEALVAQMTPRRIQDGTRFIFSTGEAVMHRLGARLPDGVVVMARGPYGPFARPTALGTWFRDAYVERYKSPPTYTAYHAAQAMLALKIAHDKASKGGEIPDADAVAAALKGITFEAFGATIAMKRADGHQAVTEAAAGLYKFDRATNTSTVTDVVYYPADCVNVPDGRKSVEWLTAGMPGAVCE